MCFTSILVKHSEVVHPWLQLVNNSWNLRHITKLLSDMDYEDVGNFTMDEDISPGRSMQLIIHEVIFTTACLFGIIADAFIIYIVFRFRRMKTVPNILLAHWAIADLASLIFTPSGYRILFMIQHISMSREFLCIIFQLGSTLHLMTIWFAMLIAIDWCIATYFENASGKLRRYYKYILATLWMFAFLFATSTGGMCLSNTHVMVHPYIIFLSYCAILLLVIGFQISRAVQKCRRKFVPSPSLMLNLVTAIVVSWFLGFINFLFMLYTRKFHLALAILGECNIFCSSIIIFILLSKLNKDFQKCFIHVIKRTGDNYEEAECHFANPIFNSHNRNPRVQVYFNNDRDVVVS